MFKTVVTLHGKSGLSVLAIFSLSKCNLVIVGRYHLLGVAGSVLSRAGTSIVLQTLD